MSVPVGLSPQVSPMSKEDLSPLLPEAVPAGGSRKPGGSDLRCFEESAPWSKGFIHWQHSSAEHSPLPFSLLCGLHVCISLPSLS